MRIETWEIMQNADLDEIELQLAFQCAPLITGLKVSNLFQIDIIKDYVKYWIKAIFHFVVWAEEMGLCRC